ncbi:DUF1565 domain-containing protein [Leptothoe spongobia]|uniref:DUF1565 domain-containing protein n=1 Tax=Leptothoe spongobia TAU-MAC 1115 TaxID=1967444 RepID=A0A947DHQ5_9CYAN|nr:DUF1565 domain-containing protein [Leptothoe spongobia]MBT9316131.1 DUF1565 domain-containing protein [Leptothoe spongobia TAU-MAC 1115]
MAALLTASPSAAQETGMADRRILSRSQQTQDYTVLHVDVATGNDQQGVGSAEQPYKTITRALEMVAPRVSTVILLAPGHYSQASGEQFPLRLRPGITIQGTAGETRNTLIVGSGEFQDGNMSHNATIVTADRSGLANIAVSNAKGSGVWISSGTPVLRRVALVANAVAGVQVTDGAPVIENSYFNRNQLGLAIRGNSRAIVRSNYFEATGRAISIASPAIPTINNNRIARNDVGIALKNNARPVLEANILNNNGRNGVVEVEPTVEATVAAVSTTPESANADLLRGRVSDGGEASDLRDEVERDEIRVIRPEARSEVAAKLPAAVSESLTLLESAPVPDVRDDVTEPEIEAAASHVRAQAAETAIISDETVVEETVESERIEAIEPVVERDNSLFSFRQHLAGSAVSTNPEERSPILKRQPTALLVSDNDEGNSSEYSSNEGAISIAVISATESETMLDEQVGDARRDGIANLLARLNQHPASDPVEVPVAATLEAPERADIASGQRLPVPSAAIPSNSGAGHLTPPGTVSLARAFRYQVLVDMADADDLQVLVPDAFRTRVGSRMFMQAGAYVDEVDAQERLDWLRENGIEGRVNLRE